MFVPGAVAIQKWNFPLFLVTNVTLEWASYTNIVIVIIIIGVISLLFNW